MCLSRILVILYKCGIQALQSLHQSVTDEHIEKMASIFVELNVVHIAAQRRPFPIDAYFIYTLSHL